MNSAQRRRAKREHPHTIKILALGHDHYYEYDDRIKQAIKWCNKKCKGSFKVQSEWDHAYFKFENHKDATIFALQWI